MSVDTWIIIGLAAGFVASKLVLRTGEGLLRDLGLGVAGAVLVGGLFGVVETAEVTGYNIFGLIATLAGATAMLVAYHTFFPHVPRG